MRFKVDENLPIEVAEALRQAGHDAAIPSPFGSPCDPVPYQRGCGHSPPKMVFTQTDVLAEFLAGRHSKAGGELISTTAASWQHKNGETPR